MLNEVFIYALMVEGRVRYVGKTVNPKQREATHRKSKWKGVSRLMAENAVDFVLLAQTSHQHSDYVEQEIMDFFRSLGECDLNQQRPCGGHFPKPQTSNKTPKKMTTKETALLLNKSALIYAGTVAEVCVTIIDAKNSYGVVRCLVKNANGKTDWRNLTTLKLVN